MTQQLVFPIKSLYNKVASLWNSRGRKLLKWQESKLRLLSSKIQQHSQRYSDKTSIGWGKVTRVTGVIKIMFSCWSARQINFISTKLHQFTEKSYNWLLIFVEYNIDLKLGSWNFTVINEISPGLWNKNSTNLWPIEMFKVLMQIVRKMPWLLLSTPLLLYNLDTLIMKANLLF